MNPIKYIPRTRELYSDYPPYRWVVNEDVPWTAITTPVSKSRIALVSSSGVHLDDQEPFHINDDTSVREIPRNAQVEKLRVTHFGYRTDDAKKDPNCVFPIERLRELEDEGFLGALKDPCFTFMGGIYSARRVRRDLATYFQQQFVRQQVDLVFLVPV